MFTLTEISAGITNFRMSEKVISHFPFFFSKNKHSVEGLFQQFAADLKNEAELITMLKVK